MTTKKKAEKIYNEFAYEFVRCKVNNATEKAKTASIDYVNNHIQELVQQKASLQNIRFAKDVLLELEKM